MRTSHPSLRLTALLPALLVLLGALGAPRDAQARGGIKWIGLSYDMKVEGIYGRGERWGKSGNQFLVSFEAAGFGKASPLGNLAGIEGGALMGYDSAPFRDSDGVLGDMSVVPIDVWVGFPVTLFNWIKGSESRLMIGFAPGIGLNWLSAYTYLKLKGAFRVTRGVVTEVQYVWWPGVASAPFGNESRGINAASLRATAYIGSRRGGFSVFAELYRSQREEERQVSVAGGASSGNNGQVGGNSSQTLFAGADPFGVTSRVAFESFFRLGVGYAF